MGKQYTIGAVDFPNMFNVDMGAPLDNRDVVQTYADLESAIGVNKYVGELVYVTTDSTVNNVTYPKGYYTYDETDGWIPFESGGTATLGEAVTAVQTVGGISSGTTLSADTTFHDFVDKLLNPFQNPTISFSISPSGKRETGNNVSSVTLTAVVTKKTANIANVKFYMGSTLLETVTSGVASGGTFTYTYTPSSDITSDTSFKATVTDAATTPNTVESNTASITFANYVYILPKTTSNQSAPSSSSDIHNITKKEWYAATLNITAIQLQFGVWICCPSGYVPHVTTSTNDPLNFTSTDVTYTFDDSTTTTYKVWYSPSAVSSTATYNKITFTTA